LVKLTRFPLSTLAKANLYLIKKVLGRNYSAGTATPGLPQKLLYAGYEKVFEA
jgi:hypothetical protein